MHMEEGVRKATDDFEGVGLFERAHFVG